jgi:uncharacterized membrane protein (DUF106 family)
MDINSYIIANPQISIIAFSLIVTVFITIITHFLTDKELMKRIKEKQKGLREQMKIHRDNPKKMMEINKQMMEDLPHQMKQSLKVSLVTLVPLLILFGWLKTTFAVTSIASSWIWWYIISSLIFSLALRKIFKLD